MNHGYTDILHRYIRYINRVYIYIHLIIKQLVYVYH